MTNRELISNASPVDLVDCELQSHAHPHVARNALKPDAAEIEALIAQAEAEDMPAIQIDLLREAVDIGRKQWEQTLKSNPRQFSWHVVECRPYLRSLMRLSQVLEEIGEIEEATRVADYILKINPTDDLTMRRQAILGHLELGNWARASTIMRAFREDESAWLGYSRVLLCLHNQGNAEPLLARAINANRHVPKFLGLRLEKPRPVAVEAGSLAEAQHYAFAASNGWYGVPSSIDWLRRAARVA